MKIRIAIIDDHPMLIRGLKGMLDGAADLEVIGTYLRGEDLLKAFQTENNRPDVLLMDLSMPEMDGEEVATALQRQYPGIAIVVFTNMEQRYYLHTMIRLGVLGYILKSSEENILLEAINNAHKRRHYFDPAIREDGIKVLKMNASTITQQLVLTKREKEILQLIAENYQSNDIAQKLFISKRTVDFHRTNLLLKLDVKSSASLIKKAIDIGLIK
jgi:DNA-binding NarL/FixJ family response regulator